MKPAVPATKRPPMLCVCCNLNCCAMLQLELAAYVVNWSMLCHVAPQRLRPRILLDEIRAAQVRSGELDRLLHVATCRTMLHRTPTDTPHRRTSPSGPVLLGRATSAALRRRGQRGLRMERSSAGSRDRGHAANVLYGYTKHAADRQLRGVPRQTYRRKQRAAVGIGRHELRPQHVTTAEQAERPHSTPLGGAACAQQRRTPYSGNGLRCTRALLCASAVAGFHCCGDGGPLKPHQRSAVESGY